MMPASDLDQYYPVGLTPAGHVANQQPTAPTGGEMGLSMGRPGTDGPVLTPSAGFCPRIGLTEPMCVHIVTGGGPP